MTKTRSSTKIAISFVALVAGAYFGYGFISGLIIEGKKFPPIEPGNVNLVGLDTRAGYYIIVANQVAKLVRGQADEFQAASHDDEGSDPSAKKRVPIREMLQSLNADEEALGEFVMAMNDMSDAEFPAYPAVWKAEDIYDAIHDGGPLRKKLEGDLNVYLDGRPLGQVRIAALEEGIVIDSPVEMHVQIGAMRRRLVARVREQFVPRFCRNVWDQIGKKSNVTPAMIAGYYRAEAEKALMEKADREDIQESLLGRIDTKRLQALAAVPERVLDSALIIVNDNLIESASYNKYKSSDGKELFDLVLSLSDEGRQRLWQYSKRHPNSQLLVTWDGIAIAAPRMQGELALSEVTVKQLTDEGLVRDAVESINNAKRKP